MSPNLGTADTGCLTTRDEVLLEAALEASISGAVRSRSTAVMLGSAGTNYPPHQPTRWIRKILYTIRID